MNKKIGLLNKFRRAENTRNTGILLAAALELMIFTPELRSTKKYFINWGLGTQPTWVREDAGIFNLPNAVSNAVNKHTAFSIMEQRGVNVPLFSTEKEDAVLWINEYRDKVACRTLLSSSGGNGLYVCSEESEFPEEAKLYVQYIRKDKEYRVHIIKVNKEPGFLIRRKRRLTSQELEARGITERNPRVRNSANGYIFSDRLDIPWDCEQAMKDQARAALEALGLDFGAVDIVLQKDTDIPFVLEVNTAPGLEGSTFNWYVEQLTKIIESV